MTVGLLPVHEEAVGMLDGVPSAMKKIFFLNYDSAGRPEESAVR